MDIEALARRIKELRVARRLTRNQVDSRSELAHSYTSRLERGLIRNPGILQLQKIADALGVKLSSLIADSEKGGGGAEGALDAALQPLTNDLADIASDLLAIQRLEDAERLAVVRRVVGDIRSQAETEVRRRRRVNSSSTNQGRSRSTGNATER